MIQVCKGCFKPNILEYCADCRSLLFAKARIGSVLSFNAPERDQLSILSSYASERGLQDIRIEYAVRQNGNQLGLADENGSHILKIVPTGVYQRLEDMPANEHLTMQLAAQVYNIYTVPNALIYQNNGQNSYITRRFDLAQSSLYVNKIPLKDVVASSGDIVDSIEMIAGLLKKYIAAYAPQIEHVYSVAIFNYLFSNNNGIYRQLSLIETSQGEYILSPAYNLLCTELHEAGSPAALYSNSVDGIRENNRYSYSDFLLLASKIGIVAKRAERIVNRFLENELLVDYMTCHSFLDEDSKTIFAELYREKLKQLKS